MVRPKRDFENDLLNELKFRAHCKNKSPNHFCDQKDLAKNLKIWMRKFQTSTALQIILLS